MMWEDPEALARSHKVLGTLVGYPSGPRILLIMGP